MRMVQFETRVESPLPGGIDGVVRYFFNLPSWLQIGGAVVGAAVALWIVWRLWRNRRLILDWVRTRERRIQLTLAGGAALVVVVVLGTGAASWNYMQHANGFCVGCHVMTPAYLRFNQPQKHDSLGCHSCHQQSIFASGRQLVIWVLEKPERIPAHGKLPNAVCERCHVLGRSREYWQRIASTAGHRTHLESGDSALRNVQCVTCHGLEVHHFAPVDSTCAQRGCHLTSETRIALGKMAGQTSLHCVVCHEFIADVPVLASRDSAAGTLRPALKQCLGCHEMKQRLAGLFDPERDPHGGTCGMCHNPHQQKSSADARKSCDAAGCHDSWRKVAFHSGAAHRRVAQQCLTCHQPHAARVDASDCTGCHTSVRAGGKRPAAPPLPFDTTRVLKQTTLRGADTRPRG